MKVVWTIVALLLVAGLVVLLQPPLTPAGSRMARDAEAEIEGLIDLAEQAVDPPADPGVPSALQAGAKPDSATADSTAQAAANSPATDGQSPVAQAQATLDAALAKALGGAGLSAETGAPPGDAAVASGNPSAEAVAPPRADPASDKPKPSTEPPPAKPDEVAAGAEFTPEIPRIPEAEILPSRFIRLPDGAISVDDAWTVRGAGTVESPYEVSWEFISSAQETYTPRLGEKKIPARIAFLSGKRVRISGYLAFPLVAPTASECLVMLNQWDGCCIGIPPTPYDAIEVKLATELKGWKKHTITFGAIEGTFKVEPYLVENWLVGLYLIEGASINTEL